jgi:hypothetical protein
MDSKFRAFAVATEVPSKQSQMNKQWGIYILQFLKFAAVNKNYIQRRGVWIELWRVTVSVGECLHVFLHQNPSSLISVLLNHRRISTRIRSFRDG